MVPGCPELAADLADADSPCATFAYAKPLVISGAIAPRSPLAQCPAAAIGRTSLAATVLGRPSPASTSLPAGTEVSKTTAEEE